MIPTIGPFLLPRVLPALRERFPGLTIYLREEQTAPAARPAGGRRGGCRADRAALRDRGLAVEDILEDEFLFACNRSHALAGAEARSRAKRWRANRSCCSRKDTACAATRWTSAGYGRHEGAGAVRGQQPAHAGADGGGRHRRHPRAAASRSRPGSRRERASRSHRLRRPRLAGSGWHGAARP